MVHSVTIPAYIDTPSLPDQTSHLHDQGVSQNDVHRFEQAMANPQGMHAASRADDTASLAIRNAVAAFENKEAKNKAIISEIFRTDREITALTVLQTNAALEERSIGYSFATKLIGAPSQWIKELTSMQ